MAEFPITGIYINIYPSRAGEPWGETWVTKTFKHQMKVWDNFESPFQTTALALPFLQLCILKTCVNKITMIADIY
jgi:hypothetical protein